VNFTAFLFQKSSGFMSQERLRCDPKALFIIFESRFEIRDESIHQIHLIEIEMTEMRAPGNIPEGMKATCHEFHQINSSKTPHSG
jgi:hypothetical protein